MKLRQAAIIATMLVILSGLAMISPLFFENTQAQPKQKIMLIFTITDRDNIVSWSQDLSLLLASNNLAATIFVEGKVVEQYPQTVECFSSNIDFGSSTYNYINLANMTDYSQKLVEIQQGKSAIDNITKKNSVIFQAPNGAVDDDIYSLLRRSGIIADFSYKDHFNIYRNGSFVKINADVFDTRNCSPEYLLRHKLTDKPIIIQFDNYLTVEQINSYISALKSHFDFVSASELLEFIQARGY